MASSFFGGGFYGGEFYHATVPTPTQQTTVPDRPGTLGKSAQPLRAANAVTMRMMRDDEEILLIMRATKWRH